MSVMNDSDDYPTPESFRAAMLKAEDDAIVIVEAGVSWHRAYRRWYDHNRAGHRVRAAIWGWIADQRADMVR